jgi:hypothetical protein
MNKLGLKRGDVVKIEGTGEWDGVKQIQDVMNKRFKGQHRIDILVPDNISHGKWNNVKIYKLEGTYIISSFIAKQCNGNDVLVFSEDKTEMTPYLDVVLGVDENNSKYTITKCGDCMNSATCQEKTIEVSKIIK